MILTLPVFGRLAVPQQPFALVSGNDFHFVPRLNPADAHMLKIVVDLIGLHIQAMTFALSYASGPCEYPHTAHERFELHDARL
jgi:hypothetical protein